MRRVTIAVLGAGLAAAALLPVGSPATAQPVESVRWQDCPSDEAPTKQCAWVTVPRDYDKPNGATLQIAISRIPATGTPAQRIGSLLWDAGGPGGESTGIVATMSARMSPEVRKRFDFVAFDPRGIGQSRPTLRDCQTPWPVRPALDPLPNWGRVLQTSAAELATANRRCVQARPKLAAAMSTNNVVRDLDRIRAALGDSRLTFWATSYGTRIGYVYALRFPERVRALVLDGNLDPSKGFATLPRVGGTSADSALRSIRTNMRPLYRSAISTMASLTVQPVDLGGNAQFTRWNWLDLVANISAFQSAWPNILRASALVERARLTGPDGDAARAALAAIATSPNGNEGGGFSVVNCLDYAERLSTDEQLSIVRGNLGRAPLMGGSLTLQYAIGCSGLGSLRPDPVPQVKTAAQRARLAKVPAVLANSTNDGSTPIVWARAMQRAFDAPLIAYRSGQHVIWGATTSQCVNRPIDRFVLDLRIPRADRVCAFVPPE